MISFAKKPAASHWKRRKLSILPAEIINLVHNNQLLENKAVVQDLYGYMLETMRLGTTVA